MFSKLAKRQRVNRRLTAIQDRMFRNAFAWCHDRSLAQDLVQEATLKAIENASQLNDLKMIDAWIFKILSNCHLAYLRKSARLNNVDDYEPIDPSLLPDQVFETQGLVEQVQIAIMDLGEDQRKVIILVDIEEFSYSEVASILEVPIGTVMSRLSRARYQLKRRLLANPIASTATVRYLKTKS